MTLCELRKHYQCRIDSIDLQRIVEFVLNIDGTKYYIQKELEVQSSQLEKIEKMIERRAGGEPLAYIFGEWGFYKHSFVVTPDVLIPRPETELVVEEALKWLKAAKKEQVKMADFGAGSGCIGLSLLKEIPQLQLISVDISSKAIAVAQKNAIHLAVDNRVDFMESDIENTDFVDLDLVVANPPYGAKNGEHFAKEVLEYEPRSALIGGESGLELIESWTRKAYLSLSDEGFTVFEFGIGQAEQIERIFNKVGFCNIKITKDYAQIPRIVSASK
jgi:release factor glutamine methyltransferase